MTTTTTIPQTTHHSPNLPLILLFTTLLTILTLSLLFKPPSFTLLPSPQTLTPTALSKLRDSVTFLPLKDLRFARSPTTGHTWFMSSLNDTRQPDEAEHLYFPSESSNHRLLCLSAHDRSDGSNNLYALAYPTALPRNATLLRGLTFVSDTYYDYTNPWHGLSAVVPFAAWHEANGCARPERWVLFHWGELRSEMGGWVRSVAEASVGGEVRVESFEGTNGGAACFERAVVFRHNEGGMGRERKERVYDLMRCRARERCELRVSSEVEMRIRVTLLFRVGGRAFKNESAVIGVFERECSKVDGCHLKVARPNNLTFCDQVKLMTETDILVSAHGAQMTNMIFMDKNSSVLEFFPRGWLELAGIGQYVFRWMADWAGMRHQGQWRDQNGDECPYENKAECFGFYKDGKIGHDEVYFASWMARVLQEVKEQKSREVSSARNGTLGPSSCSCS